MRRGELQQWTDHAALVQCSEPVGTAPAPGTVYRFPETPPQKPHESVVAKQRNGQCPHSGRHQTEVNPAEREALMAMLELIVQDRPSSRSPPS